MDYSSSRTYLGQVLNGKPLSDEVLWDIILVRFSHRVTGGIRTSTHLAICRKM